MQFMVLVINDPDFSDPDDAGMAKIGMRKIVASEDKKLSFHLPTYTYAGMRDGDSPNEVRDQVLMDLNANGHSAFVLVAEGFTCGRT